MSDLKYIGKNILNHDLILKKGDVSGSNASTGSFGNIQVSGLSQPDIKIVSSSVSTRLTAEEANVDALQTDSSSFSTRVTNLKSDSGSFSTRTTSLESKVGQSLNTNSDVTFNTLQTIGNVDVQGTLTAQELVVSSSVTNMIIAQKSGSTVFGDSMDDLHSFTGSLKITGSVTALNLTAESSSFSTRITDLKTDSGSFSTRITADSSSFSARVTTAEIELENTIISASAQISSRISGSFTAPSASFSTRITDLKTDSGSFSTRLTTEEANVDALQTDSASFSTRITADSSSFSTRVTTAEIELENTIISASAQISSRISGSFTAPSASLSARITNLKTDSGSFSSRTTTLEGTGTVQGVGTTNDVLFNSITGSASALFEGGLLRLGKPGPSSGVDGKIILHNNTGTATFTLHNQDGNGRFGVSSDNNRTLTFDNEGSGDMSIAVQGNVTADGNISGSATSTGSFGNLFGFVTPDFANSRLGIGTDAPAVTFHVKGSSNQVARFENDNGALRIVNVSVSDNFGSGNRSVLGDHSQDVLVTTTTGGGTPNNSFILLNHDGNIRIAAGASPGANEGITVLDGGNVSFSGNVSGSSTSTGSFGSLDIANNSSFGLKNTFGSLVGVNTTNPGTGISGGNSGNTGLVQIYGSNYSQLRLQVAGTYQAGMYLYNSTATATFFNGYANNTSYGGFRWTAGGNQTETDGTEIMRLWGGRLGIMNSNPPKTLSVSGDISGSGDLEIDGDSLFDGNITGSGNLEIAGNISGSSTSTGSFGNLRVVGMSVPDVTVFSSSLSTRITADSSSFSTRVTKNEGTGSKILNGQLEFTNITGSGHISMSLSSTASFGRLEATTVGGHSPLIIDAATTFTNDISSSAGTKLHLKGKVLIDTGSIEGDLHVRTNTDLMRIGKSTSGLIVSGSETISRFVTGSDGSIIDLGFTVKEEDGTISLVGQGDGLYVNDNNYWYNNTFYRIGSTNNDYIEYNFDGMKYHGEVYAQTGSIDGELFITTGVSDSMFIGKYTGGLSVSGSGNIPRFATGSDGTIIDLGFTTTDDDGNVTILGTGDGIYVDDNNYWYTTGHFKIGDSNNFINWNTSNLTVSGTFTGDGSGLTGLDVSAAPANTVSSSAQLASNISGSFTELSASLASRIAVEEAEVGSVPANTVSSSAQLASNISGSFVQPSSSFSTRVTTLEANPVFSSTGISGSFTGLSASLALRITAEEVEAGSVPTNTVSSSAQLASNISGSFTQLSASLSNRIATGGITLPTNTVSSSAQLASDISGSFVQPSSSFSTRVTSLEAGGVTIPTGTVSGSAQLADQISGSFVQPSSSFSTRVTTLETDTTADSASFSTRVTDLKSDSGSFSTRITNFSTGNVELVSGSATSTGSFGAIRSIGLPLSVDSDHVGIGTTGPGSYYNSPLVTYQASANYLTIATNTNGISSILMADGTSGDQQYRGQLEYQHDTDEWRIHAAASRVMTILNGNVGIGDTNPSEKLSVTGNIEASANITSSNLQIDGDIQVGKYSATTHDLWIRTTGGGSGTGKINFRTSTDNYGYSIVNEEAGSSDRGLRFRRHENDATGVDVLKLRRDNGTIEFPIANQMISGSSSSTGSFGVIQTHLDGRMIGNLTELIKVTVVDDGGNHYAFEGATAPSIQVSEGKTYRFDISDSTVGSHPFRFSTVQDGGHNGGSAYTTGVTVVGTQGQAGAYVELQVTKATVNHLYYYCTAHPGMGNDGKIMKNDLTNLHMISGSAQSTGSLGSLKITGNSVDFTNLPTSDPTVAGRLWNDSGTVKVSSG